MESWYCQQASTIHQSRILPFSDLSGKGFGSIHCCKYQLQIHSVTPLGLIYKLRGSLLTQNLPQEGQQGYIQPFSFV